MLLKESTCKFGRVNQIIALSSRMWNEAVVQKSCNPGIHNYLKDRMFSIYGGRVWKYNFGEYTIKSGYQLLSNVIPQAIVG